MLSELFFHHHGFDQERSWYAIGRGGHGHGRRGGFGFGPGGARGFMGGGMPGGRKFSSADLQIVLLALLEQEPAHGYQLIRALDERSNGFYAPSPGVIYPALTYLDEIGYAAAEADGNRKLYRITADGKAHLEANLQAAESMLEALGRIAGRMEEVREAFAGFHALDPQAADTLHEAHHALKHALMKMRGCNAEDAQKVAAILNQASAEIRAIRS